MPPVIHDCQQGSDEWHRLRLGIPTASCFDRILTPKTLKPSAQASGYLDECLAEYMLGEPLDAGSEQWMERGKKMEEKARDWYAFQYQKVRLVGFVTNEEGTVGCSPDGLVGDDGGLEIKVPAAKQHVAYLRNPESLYLAYRMQVQGGLWICERKWWDIVSYNPAIEAIIQRVDRDERLIEKLSAAVAAFNEQLHAELVKRGYREPEQETESDGNEGNEGVRCVRDDESSEELSASAV